MATWLKLLQHQHDQYQKCAHHLVQVQLSIIGRMIAAWLWGEIRLLTGVMIPTANLQCRLALIPVCEQEWKLQERAKEQQARDKNQEFRRLLEQQIKDNAVFKTKQPMSDVEKRLNANLLKQIQEYGIKVAAS